MIDDNLDECLLSSVGKKCERTSSQGKVSEGRRQHYTTYYTDIDMMSGTQSH